MPEVVATSNDADTAAQRASEQARLRKERREAKLKAGGSARLNIINGLAGRPQAGAYSSYHSSISKLIRLCRFLSSCYERIARSYTNSCNHRYKGISCRSRRSRHFRAFLRTKDHSTSAHYTTCERRAGNIR